MVNVQIYVDGSATISSKPGGFGWVLVIDGIKHSEGYGHIEFATNNDAELEAGIQGLVAVFKFITSDNITEHQITLISDSQIVLNWASGTNRFKQKEKIKRYEALRALMVKMNVKTQWVKGHSGNIYNNQCDKLANMGRKKQEIVEKKIEESNTSIGTSIGTRKDGVFSIWYKGTLKIIDLSNNIVDNYNKKYHGKRSSKMEIR